MCPGPPAGASAGKSLLAERLRGVVAAMEHTLGLKEGERRHLQAVTGLSKAFALAMPHEDALRIREELTFFQEVRAGPNAGEGDPQA